ncbi:MAG: LysM peptidoglycan-binding domain-containing M23 family metallopeptidase [Anaerolineales bacterium]
MAINWFSKRALQFSLLAGLLLALAAVPATAQEGGQGVRYVVQPGDTLSSISLRFDVSVQDLIDANGIADPNSLNVGEVLVIPGIDWIEGTLVLEEMPLGESYLSLKRRYLLDDEDMQRLNRFTSTSPEQLYAGFQVMLATERGELTGSARVVVAPGLSLLELAAAYGDNPWRLAAVNQLPGTWAAVPGDVLFMPGRQGEGPGGLPSPITALSLDEPGFVQGHTAVLSVAGPADMTLTGNLIEQALNFFPNEEGWVALQGIALESSAGVYYFGLAGTLPNGVNFSFTQPIRVQSGGFATATLSVNASELLDAELSAAENTRVRELMTPVTTEKMWQKLWGWPHDLVDDVTSEFGVYRKYNGGLAESFHYGVDFGGGALLSIYAPAPGRVVFAGPLDVRGNATIIDHGWGIYTGYWHQEEISVQVGDLVEAGQVIGIVGKSGRVSGPHLHWEVWVGGVPVEPLDWLARVFP